MNTIDEAALRKWCAERRIKVSAGRAIFLISSGDDDAQKVFEKFIDMGLLKPRAVRPARTAQGSAR
jgi:hypothetical protein